jgi:exopolysaccharide biosynthesis polyprenyl glycosylphosphotransferase
MRTAVDHQVAPVSATNAPAPRTTGWQTRYTLASVAFDLAAVCMAAALAAAIRFGDSTPNSYVFGSLALAPAWVALVALHRGYERRYVGIVAEEAARLLRAGLVLMATIASVSYLTKAEFARGYVLIAIPALVGLGLIGRAAQYLWLRREWRSGRCLQRTLLVGSAAEVSRAAQSLQSDAQHGLVIVGACLSDTGTEPGVPVLGDFADVGGVATAAAADTVAVLPGSMISGAQLRRLAWRLEPTGACLVVHPGLGEIVGSRITIRLAAHSPMLHLAPARLSGPARVVKGAVDRLGALLGLIVLAPALVTIAAVIWGADRGAPFFRQRRVGQGGREFTLYKFRTMTPDAEARKAELAGCNEAGGPLFKITRDPRITPIGRWLRRTSIDELPQLINVLRGEMSLVGPRPPLAEEVSRYGDDMRRRLVVKPGLTGLWQISGRSDLPWAEAERLDLRYVENWSLGSDLLILWRTARAVIAGSGAY